MYVYVVPWSEFSIVPSYPHYRPPPNLGKQQHRLWSGTESGHAQAYNLVCKFTPVILHEVLSLGIQPRVGLYTVTR